MVQALITAAQIGFVFAVLGGFTVWIKRHGNRHNHPGLINVLARAPLAGRSTAVVLTVAGKGFLVGVTENNVTLLSEVDTDILAVPDTGDRDQDTSFATVLDAAQARAEVPQDLIGALAYTGRRAAAAWKQRHTPPPVAQTADQATPEPSGVVAAIAPAPAAQPAAAPRPARLPRQRLRILEGGRTYSDIAPVEEVTP